MWLKLKWYWIKGSAIAVLVVTLELIFGAQIDPFDATGNVFLDWIITYLILLSPVGAIVGFFFLWFFAFLLDLILSLIGIESSGKVRSYVVSVPSEVIGKNDSSQLICPFAGSVYSNKDQEILGFNWPVSAEIFKINDKWEVSTPKDKTFGWIDIDGKIHKGRPVGGINPQETLSGEDTGLKVSGGMLFKGNEKIGELMKV